MKDSPGAIEPEIKTEPRSWRRVVLLAAVCAVVALTARAPFAGARRAPCRGEASLGVFAPGVLVAVLVAAIAVREVGLLQSARRRRRETRSLAS